MKLQTFKFFFKSLAGNEFILINLILIGLALIFLSGPLLSFPNTYFSASDMLQGSPVFSLNGGLRSPHNYVLGDDIFAYLPWVEFAWRNLRQGLFPLWNPYNGAGQPLMANMQSSIFFPSHWPGFFFGERVGLLTRCFLHLYLAGLFAYHYFRSLKVWAGAALAGAVAFMFGGMMVVWLYNELSATFLLFPLLLMVLERRLNRVTSALRFIVELSLVVMLQIFGGHPETIFLSVSLAALYLCYRMVSDPVNWPGWKTKLQMLGLYCVSGLLGISLGAIQLFPFLEYFLNSASLVGRSNKGTYFLLAPQYLLSFVLPNPFGNPTFGAKLDFTWPNYSEVSGSYVGLSVFFLAICSLWIVRQNRLVWFLWLLILVIVQLVYDIGPLHSLFNQLQPVAIMYNRLMGYAGFFLITLMVLTLDGLFRDIKPQKIGLGSRVTVVTAAGGVFLVCLVAFFWWFSNSKLIPFDRAKVSNFEVRDLLVVIGFFLVSLAGLVMLLQSSRYKQVGALVIILAVFGQLAFSGSNYRAAVPDAYFFPDTAITATLQKVGGRIAQAGTPGLLPAEANIWYNLEQINSYDSLGVRWFEELRSASVNRWPEWNNDVPLNLFNPKQVLAPTADPNYQLSFAKDCPQLKRAVKFSGVTIYNNLNYQPPYRFVYKSVSEPEQQGLEKLLDGKINPLDTAVFVKGEDPPELINNPALDNIPQIKVLSTTANHIKLQASNPQPGYLYIDQTYFPGWEARVNGEPAMLYRANVAFTALPVKAGELNIDLEYNPISFRLGLCLTVLSLMALSLAAAIISLKQNLR